MLLSHSALLSGWVDRNVCLTQSFLLVAPFPPGALEFSVPLLHQKIKMRVWRIKLEASQAGKWRTSLVTTSSWAEVSYRTPALVTVRLGNLVWLCTQERREWVG